MSDDLSDDARRLELRHPNPDEVREALTGDPLDTMRKKLLAFQTEMRERAARDAATQDRIAAALEGIHAELVEAREHPRFMPTGMLVVKEGSPEHRQAQIAAGVPGMGIRRQ